MTQQQTVEQRARWIDSWNKTMLTIWRERIELLDVIDRHNLYRSPAVIKFNTGPDGRLMSFDISFGFLEYGLWQDLGVGYGYSHDNGGDLPFLEETYRQEHRLDKPKKRGPKWGGGYTSGNPREPRPWFSPKYYSSVMNLSDFMAESLGQEFVGLFADLNTDKLRQQTDYYRRKGYTV